jgi:uncharacterized membrane-anchored protein
MTAVVVAIVIVALIAVVLLEWRYSRKSVSIVDLVTRAFRKRHHKRPTKD